MIRAAPAAANDDGKRPLRGGTHLLAAQFFSFQPSKEVYVYTSSLGRSSLSDAARRCTLTPPRCVIIPLFNATRRCPMRMGTCLLCRSFIFDAVGRYPPPSCAILFIFNTMRGTASPVVYIIYNK